MAKTQDSAKNHEPKLLYLAKMLNENTDIGHGLSMEEIKDEFAYYGIGIDRKTVWRNIDTLNDFADFLGLDAPIERFGKGKASTYGYAAHYFTDEEFMLIHAAIDSSRFLTEKKRDTALAKIDAFASKAKRKQLGELITASSSVHMQNEKIYYWLSFITEAIASKKKISIKYKRYFLDESKEKLVLNGNDFIVNPLAMLYLDGNCYLMGFYDPAKGEDIEMKDMHMFRVDRIDNVNIEEEEAYSNKFTRTLDPNEIASQSFGGWICEPTLVTLKVDKNSVMGVMDRFAFGYELLPANDAKNGEFCRVGVKVMPSPPFYGWVAGFGGNIKIEAPAKVKAEYEEFIEQALESQKNW